MSGRSTYYEDLLDDCLNAVRGMDVQLQPADEAVLVAALVVADAANGLRKAVLTVTGDTRLSR